MNKLFSFIKRFRALFIFVSLQIIALNAYTSYLKYPNSKVLTAAWAFSSYFMKIKNDFSSYLYLKENNRSIQKENIELRKKNESSFIYLDKKTGKVNDSLFHQRYDFISANVINSTINRRNNFFTLDVGSLQKITPGMGVFSSQGIVGIVHCVSDHFSLIKSVLSKEINIALEIEPSMSFGFLDWKGNNPKTALITGVSNDAIIKKNNPVKTRGGLLFPKGLSVGTVNEVKKIEGKPEWEISFIFSENYSNLQNVYVIKDLLCKEQKQLETKK